MSLQIYRPQNQLAQYVDMFWYWENYAPNHSMERILPNGTMDITINLTDNFFKVYHGNQAHIIHGAMLAGAQTEPFLIDTRHPTNLFCVVFKVGAALPIFNLSAIDIMNQHIALDLLWGSSVDDLYSQLCENSSIQERFYIMERYLCMWLNHKANRHYAVAYALQAFQERSYRLKISSVVDELGLSSTRFIDVFRDDIGMTPKHFVRLQRFQNTLNRIACQNQVDWVDVALACGYYDQAHFINEFQAFSGIRPTAYRPQNIEHNTNLPVLDET